MDDGNIAPENPSKQEPNQCNKRVETSQSNHKDVRRPTQMPETDNPTREKDTSHRHIWRIVTKRRKHPIMEDRVIFPYVQLRSEIVERLLNDTCEVCGEKKNVQMHHVRHVRDLNKKGKREMPLWMKVMIMRKRKSIPLCKGCHDDVHHNRPKSKRQGNQRAG